MQCLFFQYISVLFEAEWHKNAGEYGKNYDPDLQRFGDVVAKGERNQQVVPQVVIWPVQFPLKTWQR